ncbi:sensor histidine kinase [Krasilnikovia sp. MM14-A1004]|uniref:sensor histidine kinase n=1 Tax=Krasilnikovia sp. MM14-A1004 TaxID=3373541 RepID=UPI00399C921B
MTKTWLLPAVLCAAQLALWPGRALGSVAAVAVIATVVLVAAALGLRRTRPVLSVLVVAAGLTLATGVAPAEQQVFFPGDALLVISVADLVALFSVAALRDARIAALVLAGLLVWQSGLTVWQDGLTGDFPLELLSLLVVYGMVATFGRIRGRWIAERAAAARRLAQARQAHRDAADAERRRLARELHDVTAHHLTSIVVNASAARMLDRPELRAEALDFAARTGQDTLAALRRLVAIMPAPPSEAEVVAPRLADLADDFRQLGQLVTVEVPAADPPPALAAAVHGITREALTNTLRYAPGGAVRIAVSYGAQRAELVVDDDGGDGTGVAAGLGGGRGLDGMRERARALGGTLDAGPRDGGGWRVRAVFPLAAGTGAAAAGTSPRSGAPRWRRVRRSVAGRLRSQAVFDAGIVVLILLPALSVRFGAADEGGSSRAAETLLLLAMLAHAVPLLWRRARPWWVLAVVVATTWLGPLLAVTSVVSPDDGWLFLFGMGAELAAVYAVAAWGARPGLTWLAPLGAAASTATALGLLAAMGSTEDPPDGTTGLAVAVSAVAVTALFALLLALPMAACWLAGWAVRRRRSRRHAREEGGVAAAMAQAAMRAHDERARIAAGLRDAVLRHAAEVPMAAERADLDAVVGAARQALTAMRGLLDGLGRGAAGQQPEEVTSSQSG